MYYLISVDRVVLQAIMDGVALLPEGPVKVHATTELALQRLALEHLFIAEKRRGRCIDGLDATRAADEDAPIN